MARVDALQVAKYIINTAIERGEPISNLQLQKILYFTQREYYANTDELLFDDSFEAWQYGPVVPSVYYNFNLWGASPIRLKEDINSSILEYIIDKIKYIVDELLVKYTKTPPWELVNKSHDKAWNKHKDTKGKITVEDIKEDGRYL